MHNQQTYFPISNTHKDRKSIFEFEIVKSALLWVRKRLKFTRLSNCIESPGTGSPPPATLQLIYSDNIAIMITFKSNEKFRMNFFRVRIRTGKMSGSVQKYPPYTHMTQMGKHRPFTLLTVFLVEKLLLLLLKRL